MYTGHGKECQPCLLDLADHSHRTANLLLKAGPATGDCLGHVQLEFDCLQGWRLSLNSPVPMFEDPHSKKGFFFLFNWNCSSFTLCPLPLLLSSNEKNLALVNLMPSSF